MAAIMSHICSVVTGDVTWDYGGGGTSGTVDIGFSA
jgi:hypothetical protein